MAACMFEITAILREMLGDSDLELAQVNCFDELTGWDAMDLVTLVAEVECRFNLRFEPAEIDRLVTVADLLTMIKAKQALTSA